MITELKCGNGGDQKQGKQSVSEKEPCNDTPEVGTLVRGFQLEKAVRDQRQQQNERCSSSGQPEISGDGADCHTDQFSGAATADGELFAVKMERTVIPTVAAENDRQPFIQPRYQGSECAGSNTENHDQNIVDNTDDNRDQCALTGSFGGLGLGVFPDQE